MNCKNCGGPLVQHEKSKAWMHAFYEGSHDCGKPEI